jgi:hypothetical protein
MRMCQVCTGPVTKKNEAPDPEGVKHRDPVDCERYMAAQIAGRSHRRHELPGLSAHVDALRDGFDAALEAAPLKPSETGVGGYIRYKQRLIEAKAQPEVEEIDLRPGRRLP